MTINCKIINYSSPEQLESIELRRNILRKPIGLDFTKEDLKKEDKQIHIGCFYENELVGILLLVKLNTLVLKMRQVAVKESLQGKGIGKAMVQFSEQWAIENGYFIIQLHARKTAVPFYLSLQYETEGSEFNEVGIPHYFMFKELGE